MLLIELATQNVKGFSPSSRASLKPGYNVVIPPPGAQSGLLSIFSALLYSDGSGADAALANGPQARAGLTAQGIDGRVYRLVRGLGGTGALHRLEANNQWAVVAQENADIGRVLRQAMGIPGREAFELLWGFTPYSLPSRKAKLEEDQLRMQERAKAAPRGAPEAAGPARGVIRSTALVEAAMAASKSPGDKAYLSSALKEEVAKGKHLEELSYKLEGLHQRVFQLDQLITRVGQFNEKAGQLRESLAKTHSLESLGLDASALQLATRYDEAEKRLRKELQKLTDEEIFSGRDSETGRVAPVWKDQNFLASVGAGVVTLGAGIALHASGLRALALLSIPAFGYGGLCALGWIGKLQRADSIVTRKNLAKDREQKLYAAFDAEFLLVKGAMKVIDVETGKEFIEYFTTRQRNADELAAIEQQIAQASGSTDYAQAVAEHTQVTREAKALEAEIQEEGAGVSRDWREAERELQALEGGGPAQGGLVAVGGSFDGAAASATKEDPTPRLLAASQELFAGASIQSLGAAMRERASQYIAALTDRRYAGVEIDGKGNAQLVAPGRTVPAGQLEDLDLDMLYIALKLTIVERYAPLGRPVLVLDEPFLGFDDAKLQLLSRMLKHIATNTQVVHGTALPAHHGLADVAHRA